MGRIFGHREHLVRVAGLFLAAIVVFAMLQFLLIPEGFGRYGHYRAGALDDARAHPLVYAGRAACLDCHADAADAAKGGGHARVHCEACHGPLASHAGEELCTTCHVAHRPAIPPDVPTSVSGGRVGGEEAKKP